MVPVDALETYRTNWSDYAELIYPNIPDSHQEITVTAMSDKSTIHMKIGDENLDKVTSLKVNGTINSYDIMIIRNKMVNLRELDLTDVVIAANKYEYYTGHPSVDSVLTEHAFDNTRIQVAKLPKSLKRIEASTFNPKFIRELEINSGNIEDMAFVGCTVLQNLSLANCDSIGKYAFLGSGLTNLTIPASVRYIGAFAFAGRNDESMGNIDYNYARCHTLYPVEQYDGYIVYNGKTYYTDNIVIQPGKLYVFYYDGHCYPVKSENNDYFFWNGYSWIYYYLWDYPTYSFLNLGGQLMVVHDDGVYASFYYGSGSYFYHSESSRRSGGHLQSVVFPNLSSPRTCNLSAIRLSQAVLLTQL